MMPSLLKYFTIVGGILFAGLLGVNALLEPGGPGPSLVKTDAAKTAQIQFDPRASKVERLRAEEAAKKAAANAAPATTASVPAPLATTVAPPAPLPQAAPETQPTAPAALTASVQPSEPARTVAPVALAAGTNEEATRSVRPAREKARAEKVRKQRLARERARSRAVQEASAARAQDQIYYSYAPRPNYGPFAQGGWGGGGGWGRGW